MHVHCPVFNKKKNTADQICFHIGTDSHWWSLDDLTSSFYHVSCSAMNMFLFKFEILKFKILKD